MKLGELIIQYRDEHDMSLRAFARASGMSATYLSMLEKGVNRRGSVPTPSIDTYRAIARAMGIDVEQLIRAVDDKIDINSDPVLTDAERDAEMAALLDTLAKREDMRMLFKLAQDATPDDVRAAVKIIEALREK